MTGAPDRCYVVCASQRSGSTLLCRLLIETGVAGHPQEYFEATRETGLPPHPGTFLVGLPRTGAGIRDDEADPYAPAYSSLLGIENYREHLERTFALGTGENGVFGAKLMFNQLEELQAHAGAVAAFANVSGDIGELLRRLFRDPAYVWVTREDKVRQAVSLWKALQNRSWRHDEEARRHELHYRYEGIDHLVQRFEADDRGWQEVFARRGITPLRIAYEADLEERPEWAVRAVLGLIGVTPPPDLHIDVPIERQADALSEEWVARYHRDRAQYGSPIEDRPAASL